MSCLCVRAKEGGADVGVSCASLCACVPHITTLSHLHAVATDRPPVHKCGDTKRRVRDGLGRVSTSLCVLNDFRTQVIG